MANPDSPAVEQTIANTIKETARGDLAGLASSIVAALAEAGYSIVSANGMEDTEEVCSMKLLYRSANSDAWFLVHNPATGLAFVRHQANAPSGGQVTDIKLGAFLSGPRNPEHQALLRLIGSLILDPRGAEVGDEPPVAIIGREWTDAELNELGDMLVCGLSIAEIARCLRRDHGDVREKVVEAGRACR